MKTIYFLGECMVELRSIEESVMGQSFAGDVYNTAVYLKRCFGDINTSMVTAVGQDKLSSQMITRFEEEDLGTELVFRDTEKVPGLYMIETDDTGERTFSYWRNDSAAKRVIHHIDEESLSKIANSDMLFFSGISLAVIEESSRVRFWQLLEQLKAAGVTIVFDPNYRANLWHNTDEAKMLYHKALQLSDIAMPGVEDMTNLYGIDTAHGILDFCEPYGLDVIVINNGSKCIVTFSNNEKIIHDVTPVEHVVDTTSAGDAFNGAFLGAYLSGFNISDAVSMATKAAATVIQYPGAIVDKPVFANAIPSIKTI